MYLSYIFIILTTQKVVRSNAHNTIITY